MGSVSGIEISARRAIRRSLICYVRRNRGGLRLKSSNEDDWGGRLLGAKQGEKGPTIVEQIGTGLVKFKVRYESYSSPLIQRNRG